MWRLCNFTVLVINVSRSYVHTNRFYTRTAYLRTGCSRPKDNGIEVETLPGKFERFSPFNKIRLALERRLRVSLQF